MHPDAKSFSLPQVLGQCDSNIFQPSGGTWKSECRNEMILHFASHICRMRSCYDLHFNSISEREHQIYIDLPGIEKWFWYFGWHSVVLAQCNISEHWLSSCPWGMQSCCGSYGMGSTLSQDFWISFSEPQWAPQRAAQRAQRGLPQMSRAPHDVSGQVALIRSCPKPSYFVSRATSQLTDQWPMWPSKATGCYRLL